MSDDKGKTILGMVSPFQQSKPPGAAPQQPGQPPGDPQQPPQQPPAGGHPQQPGGAPQTFVPYMPSPSAGYPAAPGQPHTNAPYAPQTNVPYAPHTNVPYAPQTNAPYTPQTPVPYTPAGLEQPTIIPGTTPSPTVGLRPRSNSAAAPSVPPPRPTPMPAPAVPAVPLPAGVDPDLIVGQELGGYTIKRKLAEGGMGVVFEGEHAKIGRRGAIKVLKLEFCRSEEVIERFYQEARSVNSIRHENIVDIYDFGRDQYGRVFFVMEYLEGEPLSTRIRRGALPWSEAFPILDQTLRALKAAHDKGFVHRDLKPDNIWLKYVDGQIQVKLLDFGIAKLVGAESPREKLTQTGSVIGTPHYMSPEQINGSRDVDHRTDIYALGVITYEMFAGVTPFVGDTLQAIMTGHLFKEPPKLAELPKILGVPKPITEIIDRMLIKDAAGRYDSVADVLSDLYDVNRNQEPAKAATLRRERPTRTGIPGIPGVTGVPGLVPAPVPAEPPRGKGKRAVLIGAIAAAGIAAGGVIIWQTQKQSSESGPVVATPTPDPGPTTPVKPAPPVDKPLDYDAVRKDAQTLLRASLREAEPAVRVQGSDALAKIKDQPAAAALSELTEKDPDPEVRGHSGEALGTIGATDAAQLLTKLEADAPPPLKVWYASALARLGDPKARGRLLQYASQPDLAVQFKAALTLADISKPGDRQAIGALKALAAKEAKLNEIQPYAGALILSRMAALRDEEARKTLYALLERDHEGARLAAAEALARIGDDAGKQILQDALANKASPSQLAAAAALVSLGEYGGYDLLSGKLADKDPAARRLAARALGDIGERKSLPALIALTRDKDWTLRVAAAAAIVSIVGLDPQVLAQASVDWTKSALDSQDLAVRQAAAGVLGDIPEKEAVPLLAQAVADKDPKVRLAAARSAGKMKTAGAAEKIAAAAATEADPAVKEQQVKALGQIGSPVVRETLAKIAEETGRLGVLAAGSLIAVGDASAKSKLETAVAAPQTELRLAAVQAASSAKNAVVVPTLKTGVADRDFEVRLTAAEGLAAFKAEQAAAVPVLKSALDSKDASVFGRAVAALAKFGEQVTKVKTPAELLASADPKVRLAAVPIIRAQPAKEAVPLLRRLVADQDQEVRRAGVDAIEDVVPKDKDAAIKLYKPLAASPDPVVRAKAQGQLARLVPPPAPVQAAPPPPTPTPAPPPPVTPDAPPPPDPTLPKVQAAADEATAAATEAKEAKDAFEALSAELAKALAGTSHDDAAIKQVEDTAAGLRAAAAKLEAAAAKVEAAAKTATTAAGSSPIPEVTKLVGSATAAAQAAREAATAARAKVAVAARDADNYKKTWIGDPQMLINAADASIATGNLADARVNLDKATKILQRAGTRNPGIDFSYAQLYDKMAKSAKAPADKRKLLEQAKAAYQRFAAAGAGPRKTRAAARAAELTDEIKELGP